MKRKILSDFLAVSSAVLVLAGCQPEEKTTITDPISFTGSIGNMTVVAGDRTPDYRWNAGEQAGIFVGATVEIPYRTDEASASTSLSPVEAGIPASTGAMAYAYFPGTGESRVYVDVNMVVPEQQTFSAGHNPNALNLAAMSSITDRQADLEFKHMGAILDLGLASDENITIYSMMVSIPQPAAGSYIAGTAKINFLGDEPVLDEGSVKNGANSIMVSFPDGLTLTSGTQYIPVGVLPFSTLSGGIEVTVYDEIGKPCPLEPVFAGNSEIGENGAVSLASGEYASCDLGKISEDQFLPLSQITIRVTDDKTGNVRAGQEINLYSVMNTTETFIETLTTSVEGTASALLNAGNYKAYTAYGEGIPEEYNTISFTVQADNPETVDFTIYPYLFVDSFDWVEPDMGVSQELLRYYDVPNGKVNNASPAWTTCSDELKAILAEKGWTFSDFVYPRPGQITLGKKNTAAASGTQTAETPKFSGLTGTSDVKVTVIATPYHTVSGGVWTLERSYLEFIVNGGGTINGATSLVEPEFVSGGQEEPDKSTTYEFTITGATPSTSVTITNKQPGDATGSMWRCLIEEVRILEAY